MKSLKAKFRKSDVHEWNKNDERLLAAVEHGEVEKVASLLAKKGASAVKLDSEGKSALHIAATRGHLDCLSVILAHGADLSITDAAGSSALHLAAKNNHLECVKKLIQSKCAVDAVDSSGKTALHYAAANGNVPTVTLLCEQKSPINLRDAEGFSPLLLAASHAHVEVCSTLIDLGADVNASDNNGRTVLMLASESCSGSIIDVLVRRGADLWAVDSQGHDAVRYAKLSGNTEGKAILTAALQKQQDAVTKSARTPQHDQIAKLNDERITSPKKRKAPPPPISPLQSSGLASPGSPAPMSTPLSSKSDPSKTFNYKEDEARGAVLRDEVEKLQEEKSMLLDTIEDLRQIVEQTPVTGPEQKAKTEHSSTATSALVSVLQAKIAALTLENQQLANIVKKQPSLLGGEDLKDSSRPNSMASNSSFHSTRDDFDSLSQSPFMTPQIRPVEGDGSEGFLGSVFPRQEDIIEEEESEIAGVGDKDEIRLLRQALESVQTKVLESQKENCSPQAQLKPGVPTERSIKREEDETERETEREEEFVENQAELQAKLTEAPERYYQALEEVQESKQDVQGRRSSLEQEVKELKSQLVQSGSEWEKAAQRMKQLEEELRRAEEQRELVKGKQQEIEELYKDAQEEIRMLQDALRGTVPVEAAAKDFEEMKAELNEVISGLQRRLLELSHSYSDTKSQLSAAQKQLSEIHAGNISDSSTTASSLATSPTEQQHLQQQQQMQMLKSKVEELQTVLAEAEKRCSASQQEVALLRQEAEAQAQGSIALTDHTQVVSSLGNAIKELESQSEALKQQLSQKTLQVDALQNRLAAEKNVTPDDSVSHLEHETMREGLEGEVNHLTQLLQGALRKQDEMALEAAAAWQEVRESRAEREALQELVMTREKENQVLTSRLAESQDAISQLKQLVENHISSEREKNKKIDDLSREVGKLKDALNSLSQLSYSSSSSTKRQQQSQQLETMQQQIKQLQYQLAESKKQHQEIVSVYRMHLLYAVQGQMDEDVQKALKQILIMCKMPNQAKDAS
ncbi:ankycorbin isoform X3 [Lampris incognitus]|uniref:ankycorbin isoform X3 n=1 Tax=Lampris incognitus TaxID=2546036 RepID=UPI0024B4F61C|nr:ankycorbin isoform X3 [Lampris incognitus]